MVLDPLAQINLITVAATIIIFIVTLAALRRVVFLPVIRVMELRAARIENARRDKAQAQARLEEGRREADQILAAANAEAAQILDAARAECAAIRRNRMQQATAEADAILAAGRVQAADLRQSELARLEEELTTCAGQTLARMIGTVDATALRFTVKRVLATRETG
jgi:F-type H+-transporting ATPase subunit b